MLPIIPPPVPSPQAVQAEPQSCCAGGLCGMPVDTPLTIDPSSKIFSHKCLGCGGHSHGALCHIRFADCSDHRVNIPRQSLPPNSQRLCDNDTAIICKLCVQKYHVSTPLEEVPVDVLCGMCIHMICVDSSMFGNWIPYLLSLFGTHERFEFVDPSHAEPESATNGGSSWLRCY